MDAPVPGGNQRDGAPHHGHMPGHEAQCAVQGFADMGRTVEKLAQFEQQAQLAHIVAYAIAQAGQGIVLIRPGCGGTARRGYLHGAAGAGGESLVMVSVLPGGGNVPGMLPPGKEYSDYEFTQAS